MNLIRGFVVSLLLVGMVIQSNASTVNLTVTFSEVGSNVVATFSGSIDLTNFSPQSPSSAEATPYFDAASGFFQSANSSALTYSRDTWPNRGWIGLVPFGTGNLHGDSRTGDEAGWSAGYSMQYLYVSPGYISNSPLSGTATWNSATLSSLGITQGTYFETVGNNTFKIEAVPEPSALSLLVVGLGGLAVMRRKRS